MVDHDINYMLPNDKTSYIGADTTENELHVATKTQWVAYFVKYCQIAKAAWLRSSTSRMTCSSASRMTRDGSRGTWAPLARARESQRFLFHWQLQSCLFTAASRRISVPKGSFSIAYRSLDDHLDFFRAHAIEEAFRKDR